MTDAANELVLTRVLDAPCSSVWRCWTEPELLKQWFCPKPWYVSAASIDLRPGGEFSTVMNGPAGEQVENPGVILAVEPERRLVTTDAFRPGWLPTERAFMTTEITFETTVDGKTRYTARAMHWSAEAKQEHEAMGFHEGWGKATDQLEILAATFR